MFGTRIEFENEAQDITSEEEDGDGCKNSFTCPVPFNEASNWTYAMERFHPRIPSISAFSSITACPCLSYWTAKGFTICQTDVVVVVFEGRMDIQDGQRTNWQTSKPFIVEHIHGRTSCCSVLLLIMLFVAVLLSSTIFFLMLDRIVVDSFEEHGHEQNSTQHHYSHTLNNSCSLHWGCFRDFLNYHSSLFTTHITSTE